MSVSIKGAVALVTGANRGIGAEIVKAFIANGAAKVYLAVRDIKSTEALEAEYGDKVKTVFVDMGQADTINELSLQASDVNIVVNNAGVLIPANPLSDNVEDALAGELNVNVYGLLRIAKAFSPILKQKENAAFVQLNSVASINNFHDLTTYSASKAAAYSITQGLRDNWADTNIDVISVHPGPILTDMGKAAGLEDISEPAHIVADAIIEGLSTGQFHVFPDTVAKQFEGAYSVFADSIINADPDA